METFESDEACAAAIARIGALDVQLGRIEATKASHVAAAAKEAEDRATPLQEERAALELQVAEYATANRERLTDGHRSKTANFTTGAISWRLGKDRVVIDPTLQDKVLERLKRLQGFTRTKVEPDLTAIGKSLAEDKDSPLKGIRGIRLQKGVETVAVKPTTAELVERR